MAALGAGLRRGFGRGRTRSMCYGSVVGVVIAALMRVTVCALVAPSGLIIAVRACVGAFIPLVACRRIVLCVVIAACAVIPIGIVAAAICCGILLVCVIHNLLGILVTESGENNAVVVGDLHIAGCVLKPLAAAGANIVCLVAVLGAGCSLSRNRCHVVSMTQSRSNDIAALCAGLRRGFGRCRTRSMCYRSVVGVVIAALMRMTAFALVAPSGLIIAMRACVGAFIPLIACRRIVLCVVIAACAVIPIGIVAAAIGCGSLLVCSILNSLGIVVTESGENNTAVIGDLYIGCRILKPLAADIALVVCLVAVFGAGGSLSRNRCQAMGCKRKVGNGIDLIAGIVEQLTAVVTLEISVPAFFFTSGSLCGDRSLACVCARCIF